MMRAADGWESPLTLGSPRCRLSAGELTLNCVSLSLLEVDLDG